MNGSVGSRRPTAAAGTSLHLHNSSSHVLLSFCASEEVWMRFNSTKDWSIRATVAGLEWSDCNSSDLVCV